MLCISDIKMEFVHGLCQTLSIHLGWEWFSMIQCCTYWVLLNHAVSILCVIVTGSFEITSSDMENRSILKSKTSQLSASFKRHHVSSPIDNRAFYVDKVATKMGKIVLIPKIWHLISKRSFFLVEKISIVVRMIFKHRLFVSILYFDFLWI